MLCTCGCAGNSRIFFSLNVHVHVTYMYSSRCRIDVHVPTIHAISSMFVRDNLGCLLIK